MRAWPFLVVVIATGCEREEPARAVAPAAEVPCRRAFGEKLGVPFVRVCPADLPGVVTAPFWIASAPIGCLGGEHGTVTCPSIVALAPLPPGAARLEPRTAQVIEAMIAHRTCTLRFGGRLPSTLERAQAREALGLVTLVVTESAPPESGLALSALPEWTTAQPCLDPSTLRGSCAVARTPTTSSSDVAWPRLRACSATLESAAGALIVTPGESCPAETAGAPRCMIAARAVGTASTRAFALACRTLTTEQQVHPEPAPGDRAAFRCVVPEGALTGTVVTP